jgi:hypothetical protein
MTCSKIVYGGRKTVLYSPNLEIIKLIGAIAFIRELFKMLINNF